MSEIYTDQENKEKRTYNSIYNTLKDVGRAFGTNNVEIKIKLSRKRIEQISKDMMIEYGKSGMISTVDQNLEKAIFTKFQTPFGKIEFIDNGE